jgi:hypothetical protein
MFAYLICIQDQGLQARLPIAPVGHRKEYLLKLGTGRTPFRVEQIHRVIDASELSAVALRQEDIEVIRTSDGSDRVMTVWLGDRIASVACDLNLTEAEADAKPEREALQ